MRDYDKPVGWWCNADGKRVDDLVVAGGLTCPRCIPVYAVIPEGQRPEAEEPDADTVLRCVDHDVGAHTLTRLCLVRDNVDGDGFGGERRSTTNLYGAPCGWHLFSGGAVGSSSTLIEGEAVLWVAEGVLP
jgi:hypothetical protein